MFDLGNKIYETMFEGKQKKIGRFDSIIKKYSENFHEIFWTENRFISYIADPDFIKILVDDTDFYSKYLHETRIDIFHANILKKMESVDSEENYARIMNNVGAFYKAYVAILFEKGLIYPYYANQFKIIFVHMDKSFCDFIFTEKFKTFLAMAFVSYGIMFQQCAFRPNEMLVHFVGSKCPKFCEVLSKIYDEYSLLDHDKNPQFEKCHCNGEFITK